VTVYLYVAVAPPWQTVSEEEATRPTAPGASRWIPAGGIIMGTDENYVRNRAAALGWHTFRIPAERWSFGLVNWTGDENAPW